MNKLKNSKLVNRPSKSPNSLLIFIVYLAVASVISTIGCDEGFNANSSLPADIKSSFIQRIFQSLPAYARRLSLSSFFNLDDPPKKATKLPAISSSPLECGQRVKFQYEGRIVGGHATSVADFP